ncbi:hypothetical protein [Limobrevibacterium gyesilva]|uniref:Uncharacterized protein n=1 Tax=Limobrevibacterium gyesilva TaxID=2991712 RepID=A0AA41YNK2_9PROT|nr:hypothetical protein [Limobrevibacterium gyesilva]MCW3475980.1 hypothetical protein [Limobrevibacterium gyesilva]
MRNITIGTGAALLGSVSPLMADTAPGASDFVSGGTFETKLQSEYSAPAGSKPRVSVFNDADLTFYANYSGWLSLNGKGSRTVAPALSYAAAF